MQAIEWRQTEQHDPETVGSTTTNRISGDIDEKREVNILKLGATHQKMKISKTQSRQDQRDITTGTAGVLFKNGYS